MWVFIYYFEVSVRSYSSPLFNPNLPQASFPQRFPIHNLPALPSGLDKALKNQYPIRTNPRLDLKLDCIVSLPVRGELLNDEIEDERKVAFVFASKRQLCSGGGVLYTRFLAVRESGPPQGLPIRVALPLCLLI